DLGLDDLQIPVPEVSGGTPTGKTVRRPWSEVQSQLGTLAQQEAEFDNPDPNATTGLSDEASALSMGVRFLDDGAYVLRQLQVKVQNRRTLIALADVLIARMQAAQGVLTTGLVPAGKELTEARHDYAVALALVAEDQARVDAVNARRTQVLRDHVRFVAF